MRKHNRCHTFRNNFWRRHFMCSCYVFIYLGFVVLGLIIWCRNLEKPKTWTCCLNQQNIHKTPASCKLQVRRRRHFIRSSCFIPGFFPNSSLSLFKGVYGGGGWKPHPWKGSSFNPWQGASPPPLVPPGLIHRYAPILRSSVSRSVLSFQIFIVT